MLPNILNMAPMGSSMPTSPFVQAPAIPQSGPVPGSGTVGFDFNSYLLGLQNNAVDGAVDWKSLLQSTDPASQSKDPLGVQTETDASANGMGALAALFNLPAATIDGNGKRAPIEQELANQTRSVDWKALGMTKVDAGALQEQGWDLQKVEQLFSSRAQDLRDANQVALEKTLEQLPGAKLVKVEGQPEKAHAFQNEALTANQPVLKMAEKSEPQYMQTVGNTPARQVEIAAVKPEVAHVKTEVASTPAMKPTSDKTIKPRVSSEDSLFSAMNQGQVIQSGKNENLTVQATAVTTASSAPVQAQTPEWVTNTESLARAGGGKMTIALTPPELGKVEIEVVTRGKNVSVEMRSENDGARKALESGMADLKSALLGQDLVLSRSEVKVAASERFNMDGFSSQNFNNNNSQNHQTSQQEQRGNGNPNGYSNSNAARWEGSQAMKIASSQSPVTRHAAVSNGRVDVRI